MKNNILVDVLILIICLPLVMGANQYPSGNIIFNVINTTSYGLYNASNISADKYYYRNGTELIATGLQSEADPWWSANKSYYNRTTELVFLFANINESTYRSGNDSLLATQITNNISGLSSLYATITNMNNNLSFYNTQYSNNFTQDRNTMSSIISNLSNEALYRSGNDTFYNTQASNNFTQDRNTMSSIISNLSNEALYRSGNDSLKPNLIGNNIFTGNNSFIGTIIIYNSSFTSVNGSMSVNGTLNVSGIINSTGAIYEQGSSLNTKYNDSAKANTGNCATGSVVMNTTTTGVQCVTMTVNSYNSTADMRNAINNSGLYNISINSSNVVNNPTWITSTITTNFTIGSNCIVLSSTSNASLCFNTTCTWLTSPDGLTKAKVANNDTTC